MKKLLTLLSVTTMVGTLSTNVVSCSNSNKYDKKDGDGNSLIYFLEGTNGTNYSSKDAWNNLNIDGKHFKNGIDTMPGSVKLSITQSLMKIFNVSALATLGNDDKYSANNLGYSTSTGGTAGLGDIHSLFGQLWTKLTDEVNEKVKSKKKDEGKNWDKFLKDKYDGSEDVYKAFLYAQGDGTDSASDLLASSLINYYQSNFYNISGLAAKQIFNEAITSYNTNHNWTKFTDNSKWLQMIVASSNSVATPITISKFKTDLATALSGTTTINNYDDLSTAHSGTYKEIADDDKVIQTNNSAELDASTEINPTNYLNMDYNDISTNNLKGVFSPFQQFIENKWYSTKKPLAVSQIVVKYGTPSLGDKFDMTKDKLSDFNSLSKLFDTDTISKFNTINNFLTDSKIISTDPTKTTWDNLLKDINAFKNDSISGNYSKDLLTVDSTADATSGFGNDEFKDAVYSSLDEITKQTGINNIDLSSDGTNFINSINRNTSINSGTDTQTMYKVFKAGPDSNIVAYFDAIGLHLVHIDGSMSTSHSKLNPVADSSTDTIKTYTKAKQEENISGFNKYNKTDGVKGNITNNTSGSDYLDFLNKNQNSAITDNTYLKGNYSYDISAEIKAFAKFTATDNTVKNYSTGMWYWNYDLTNWYLSGSASTPDSKWLDKILKFNNDHLSNLFHSEVNGASAALNGMYLNNLSTSIQNILTTNIKNYQGPQGGYDFDTLLSAISQSKLWSVYTIEENL